MTDVCIFDLHTQSPTMTEVLSAVKAWRHAFPEFEILEDGDRYGVFARRKVNA